jgi:hypothetical protein
LALRVLAQRIAAGFAAFLPDAVVVALVVFQRLEGAAAVLLIAAGGGTATLRLFDASAADAFHIGAVLAWALLVLALRVLALWILAALITVLLILKSLVLALLAACGLALPLRLEVAPAGHFAVAGFAVRLPVHAGAAGGFLIGVVLALPPLVEAALIAVRVGALLAGIVALLHLQIDRLRLSAGTHLRLIPAVR